MIQGV